MLNILPIILTFALSLLDVAYGYNIYGGQCYYADDFGNYSAERTMEITKENNDSIEIDTGITVDNKLPTYVRLDDTHDNIICACGNGCGNIIDIQPIFDALTKNEWESNRPLTNDQKLHPCIQSLDPQYRSRLTKRNIWKLRSFNNINSDPNDPIYAQYKQKQGEAKDRFKRDWFSGDNDRPGGKCAFHAKNPYYIDTGIDIKHSDEFSISWSGNYIISDFFNRAEEDVKAENTITVYGDAPHILWKAFQDYKHTKYKMLRKIDIGQYYKFGNNKVLKSYYNSSSNNIETKEKFAKKLFYISSALDIKVEYLNSTDKLLVGEDAGSGDVTKESWYGLKGTILSQKKKKESCHNHNAQCATAYQQCKASDTSIDDCNIEYQDCLSANNQSTGHYKSMSDICVESLQDEQSYLFSGTVDNPRWSSNKRIFLRHFKPPEITEQSPGISKSLGGFKVSIIRRGCPIRDGTGLYYKIGDGEKINIENPRKRTYIKNNRRNDNAKLYIGVDLEDYNNNGSGGGSYMLSVKTPNPPTSGFIGKIIQEIYYIMYNEKTGAVKLIFSDLIQNSKFKQIVMFLLIMYVTFLGLGFVMGIMNVNQKDLITRIIKIAIIIALISDRGWVLFHDYFLIVFKDGIFDLIDIIVAEFVVIPAGQKGTGGIGYMDAAFTQLFSEALWAKVGALLIGRGFIIAIILILAAVIYIIVMFKVIAMFVMCIIFVSFLVCLGPIFIVFMLFGQTKQFFDKWWKQILSFSLQPVIIITMFFIFHYIIINLIYTTLNFTVCKGCAIQMLGNVLHIPLPGVPEVLMKVIFAIAVPLLTLTNAIKTGLYETMGDNKTVQLLLDQLNFIPGIDAFFTDTGGCLLHTYVKVSSLHYEMIETFNIMSLITLSITLYILSYAMWHFCDFVSQLTARLISSQYVDVGTAIGPFSKAKHIGTQALGLDQASYAKRLENAQNDLDKKQAELQDAKTDLNRYNEIEAELQNPDLKKEDRIELEEKQQLLGNREDLDQMIQNGEEELSSAKKHLEKTRTRLEKAQNIKKHTKKRATKQVLRQQ